MKFQNTNAAHDLNFSICGKTYHVPADGEVDVDPAHVPYVTARGLQLEPAKAKPKAAEPKKPEPKKPEPKVEPKADPKPEAK